MPTQTTGMPRRRERVDKHSVGGEQVSEHHPFPGHHLADLLCDLARCQLHGGLPTIGTMTPLTLYGTSAPVSYHNG